MALRNKYPPSTVTRYLPPNERSWGGVVYQQGRLVLDAELFLNQDIRDYLRNEVLARQVPSGFLRGQTRGDSYNDFSFDAPWLPGPTLNPDFVPNSFHMRKIQALVAGMPVTIEYTNIDNPGDNLITLEPPTPFDGTPPSFKRTDFVFLEVWMSIISESPNAKGTLLVADPLTVNIGDTVTVDGNVFTGVVVVPLANQFRIFPGNPIKTAESLANQINAGVGTVTAVNNANIVQITANVAGLAGNAIGLASSNATAIVPSGLTLTGGVDTSGKPSQDTIFRHGNVLSSVTVALPDDIEDPILGSETSKRVQIQYRIRRTDASTGVDFAVQADGFSNPNILAQGPNLAPVADYPFVPADLKTVILNSDARNGTAGTGIGYGILDNGLYIAGNGTSTSATDLGTLDGYVYAIPICFVFRRNDAFNGIGGGFDPQINTNGGLPYNHPFFANPNVYNIVQQGESDRPDGYFADAIVDTDILDLRRHVKLTGQDLSSELQFQMQALMDGQVRTWAIDTASKQELGFGSGDVSTRNLVCNEVGRTAAKGGNPPLSGDTTRGETIRNFDHFARRFGSQPVVERVVIEVLPNDNIGINPGKYVERPVYALGYAGWAEGDIIHLDLLELNATTLGDFDPASATIPGPAPTGTVFDFAPVGSIITDVLSAFHDDGNFGVVVPQEVQPTVIQGLGTSHLTLQLDENETQVNGGLPVATSEMVGTFALGDVGSQRRIFLEVEITYPLGLFGLTDTPDFELTQDANPYPFGPMLENYLPTGPNQRPLDMETPLEPNFRQGFREVHIEYVANDPTGGGGNTGVPIGGLTPETFVSRDALNIVFLRRVYGGLPVTVIDQNDLAPRSVDINNSEFGSSSRLVVLENTGIAPAIPLSGTGQTLVEVTYFAQDPIPNYGSLGQGYQQSIYFRTSAPQTAGTKEGTITSLGIVDFPYTGAPGGLPTSLLVEPVYISQNVWTGQVGMGSTELPFPHFAPLDQIPVNDGRTEIPPPGTLFPGEWYFAASANISIDDFDAQVGTLALHALVPAEGSIQWDIGGALSTEEPFRDTEFRAVYPVINKDEHRPTPMGQGNSNVVRHKVFVPTLCRSLQDCVLFRKNEVLLVILTRWAELDAENTVRFLDSGNRSGASVFRTKNLLLLEGNEE